MQRHIKCIMHANAYLKDLLGDMQTRDVVPFHLRRLVQHFVEDRVRKLRVVLDEGGSHCIRVSLVVLWSNLHTPQDKWFSHTAYLKAQDID